MKRKHLNFSQYKKKILQDSALRAEYERLDPEFALIEAVLRARKEKGLTQKELAKKIGTKQSVISHWKEEEPIPRFHFLKN
jgi:ribosome-binding protein aMBF1 (putative translation factor)